MTQRGEVFAEIVKVLLWPCVGGVIGFLVVAVFGGVGLAVDFLICGVLMLILISIAVAVIHKGAPAPKE